VALAACLERNAALFVLRYADECIGARAIREETNMALNEMPSHPDLVRENQPAVAVSGLPAN
jgi:hypothetical protein